MHVPIGRAIAWAAMNDETTCMDVEQIAYQVTTLLIADLFDKEPKDIARRILDYRIKYLDGSG